MNKFTPLHIEILIHYISGTSDYRDGDFSASAVAEYINDLHVEGLLTRDDDLEFQVTEKGRAVIDYICNTPMPEQEWMFPGRDGE